MLYFTFSKENSTGAGKTKAEFSMFLLFKFPSFPPCLGGILYRIKNLKKIQIKIKKTFSSITRRNFPVFVPFFPSFYKFPQNKYVKFTKYIQKSRKSEPCNDNNCPVCAYRYMYVCVCACR